jgi:hypothetical protein
MARKRTTNRMARLRGNIMSLLNDFNQVKHLISKEVVIEDYSNEFLEAYIPNKNVNTMTNKIRNVAKLLEQLYTRPVHIYVNKSRCMIKLR